MARSEVARLRMKLAERGEAEFRLRRKLAAIREQTHAVQEELRGLDEDLGNFFREAGYQKATEDETDDTDDAATT